MLDIRRIRTDAEGVKAALARRNDPSVAVRCRCGGRARLRAAPDRQEARRRPRRRPRVVERGAYSAQFRRRRRRRARPSRRREQLGDRERELDARYDDVASQLREILLRIPNTPAPDAPDGAGPDDNVVMRVVGYDPDGYSEHQRVPHWEIGAELGLLDPERAAKLSGSMFVLYRGMGARLVRALTQLALDRHTAGLDAYEEVRPPTLVRTDTMVSTGHLPKFDDDAYHLERDDLWAIPTAEVPLTSMHRDEILDQRDLPTRFCAYTPCFRREAGSAGADTRGVLRSHEFDKVELFSYCTPEQAADVHADILSRAESLLVDLALPVPRRRPVHRRPRLLERTHLRSGGVRARVRSLARGVVGLVVLRLPSSARERSLPPRRWQGHRDVPHRSTVRPSGGRGSGLPCSRRTGRSTGRSRYPRCCIRISAASTPSRAEDRRTTVPPR